MSEVMQDRESERIRKDLLREFSTESSAMSMAVASAEKMEASGWSLLWCVLLEDRAAAPTSLSFLEPSVKMSSAPGYLSISFLYSALKVLVFVLSLLCVVSCKSTFALVRCHGGRSGKRISWMSCLVKFKFLRSSRILRPKGLMSFSLFWNLFVVSGFVLKMLLCAGFSGVELCLTAYCSESCVRLSESGGMFASAWRLSTGEVRKAPRARRSPWFCTGSSIFKMCGFADQ